MNKRNAWAWLFVLGFCATLFACGSPPVKLEAFTAMDSFGSCDLGILRLTRSMRCEEEFNRQAWR